MFAKYFVVWESIRKNVATVEKICKVINIDVVVVVCGAGVCFNIGPVSGSQYMARHVPRDVS